MVDIGWPRRGLFRIRSRRPPVGNHTPAGDGERGEVGSGRGICSRGLCAKFDRLVRDKTGWCENWSLRWRMVVGSG